MENEKAKHTPGPWLRIGTLVYQLQHCGWRKGVEQLCNRFTVRVDGGRDRDGNMTPVEELEANARLIETAPELLDALKQMVAGKVINNDLAVHPSGDFCTVCGTNSVKRVHAPGCAVDLALNAIAKAEGRA